MSSIPGKVNDPALSKILGSLQKELSELKSRINKLEKEKANKSHTH